MKKFRIVLWVILIVLLALVFFQNKAFFMGKQALILNLYAIDELQSSPLPIAVWFLVALCIGFVVAYFFALVEKFKTKRMMKALKAQTHTQMEMITQLKNELETHTGFQSNDVMNVQPPGHGSEQDSVKI